MFVVTSLLYNSYFAKNDLPHLPLLFKYHAFYNILYFISSIERGRELRGKGEGVIGKKGGVRGVRVKGLRVERGDG